MKLVFLAIGFENLAVQYLSSYLFKHNINNILIYDYSLFDEKYYCDSKLLAHFFSIRKKLIKRIFFEQPDLIAISVFTHNYKWAKEITSEIKKKSNIPVILGGLHPTIYPDFVLNDTQADYICIGEGEHALLELCQRLEQKLSPNNIKNIWVKDGCNIIKNDMRPLISDLDSLPFPNKNLFDGYLDISDVYMISASRGCINNCTYCGAAILHKILKNAGNYYRIRTPENVIDELALAKDRYNIKTVNFVDNIFTLDKKWTLEFLNLYKEKIKLPFRCLSYPSYIDEDIVKMLKMSNCYQISIGIQTFNEQNRKLLLNRNLSNEMIFNVFRLFEKYGLKYNVDHILGIHNEDFNEQIIALEIYSDFKPSHISCFWLTYLPGTKLTAMAVHLNILNVDEINEIMYGNVSSFHSHGSIKKNIRKFEQVNAMFSLLPLLPFPINKVFIKLRIFNFFVRPMFLKSLFDIFTAIKNKDWEKFYFIKYYIKSIFKVLKMFFY